MSGPIFPRQSKGHRLHARDFNDVARWVERATKVTVAPPLEMISGSGGTHIRLAASSSSIRVAKTGASPPGALSGSTPGAASVTLYDFGGSGFAVTSPAETVTAYNIGGTAVGANKFILIQQVGIYWFVIVESC